MTENFRRCAICKRRLFGVEQNDSLVTVGKSIVANKVSDVWVCAGHKYTLFRVSVGNSVVLKDDAKEIRIGVVESVTKTGSFKIGSSVYSQFGQRMRGYGQQTVLRMATTDDVERHRKQILQTKLRKIEQDEAARKQQELRENLLQKFKITFPQLADNVSISAWDNGKFEFTIYLTADEIESLKQ